MHRTIRNALTAGMVAACAMTAGPSTLNAAGKPGYPDKIVWNGVTWDVKSSRSAVGPGPNIFAASNAWVDSLQRLHLRIVKDASGRWTCAEVIGPTSYGYGTYTFTLASPVSAFDPNIVLGLFTWSDKAPYAHREIDIEFAKWANASDPTNAQYVVQPYDVAGHLRRFTAPPDSTSTHRFSWRRGAVSWDSYSATGALVASYSYAGSDVPLSGDERVHLNFWLFNGAAPTDGTSAEVIVSSFAFAP